MGPRSRVISQDHVWLGPVATQLGLAVRQRMICAVWTAALAPAGSLRQDPVHSALGVTDTSVRIIEQRHDDLGR